MRPSTFTVSRRMILRRRACALASPETAITEIKAVRSTRHRIIERMSISFGLLRLFGSIGRLLLDLALRRVGGSTLLGGLLLLRVFLFLLRVAQLLPLLGLDRLLLALQAALRFL